MSRFCPSVLAGILGGVLVANLAIMARAHADTYPLSGTYAYQRPGLAPDAPCGQEPVMKFNGERRYDSNGSVREYRNMSVMRQGTRDFQVVDLFSNGQVRNGKVSYTLRLIDGGRVEIRYATSGKRISLQRCE